MESGLFVCFFGTEYVLTTKIVEQYFKEKNLNPKPKFGPTKSSKKCCSQNSLFENVILAKVEPE